MAISTTALQQKQERQKRTGAIGNFLTAPFKNIPNAIREIGSGLSSLRPAASDVRAQSRQVVQPSQSMITRSKLTGQSPLTTLGPQRPGSLPMSGGRPLNNTMGPVPRSGALGRATPGPESGTTSNFFQPNGPPIVPTPLGMTNQDAQTRILSSSGASNGGFSSQLDPMDPAAIGGRLMQKPYDVAAGQAGAATNVPTPAQTQIKEDNKQSELERARQAYLQSLAPPEMSEEEKAYQDLIAQQARLSASEELGLNKIKDQPIALDFLTGQSAALQRNVAAQQQALASQAVPLEQRIVQEQARRQALQAQREAELGFLQSDMEAQNVTPIEVGGRLVNPRTGEVIYEAPAEAGKPMTLSPGETVFDPTTGRVLFTAPERPSDAGSGVPTIKDINGTSMQWDEASGQWVSPSGVVGAGTDSAAIDVLNNKLKMIDDLMTSPGMRGSVGPYGVARWTPFSADAAARQDFAAGVNQLIAKDTMDVLLNLKRQGGTLGALSDQERILLQNAASKIGSWTQRDKQGNPTGKFAISEDLFKKELQTIRDLTQKALERAGGFGGSGGSGDELDQMLDQLGFESLGRDSQNALRTLTIGNRNVRVATPMALRLARAAKDFKAATGKDLQINQDFRSHEEQARLYKELSAKGARVAPPGKSFHEKGLAIDVTNWQEAQPFLRKYGLYNDLPDDRGHFSLGETRKIG